MSLSAVVITKNEEKKIAACLKALSWVDELIVIDTGSTDETIKIAKRNSSRVISYTSGKNFSDWRNKGRSEAKSDWLLYVDADERVSTDLKGEIKEKIETSRFSAFAIPRRNFVLGKELKHGGLWPDYQKRLFKKEKLRKWVGELHEQPTFDGDLGHLKNPFIHLKHDKIEEMVEKTNHWSEIEAKLMYEAGHPKMNLLRFASAIFREFWLRLIRQLAFLDGSIGIIYALYQVYSRFISYAKLWEMQLKLKTL